MRSKYVSPLGGSWRPTCQMILSKKGVQDRSRINVHEPWEVRFWARELETTEQKLREAVKAVGPQVKAVRKQLAMREA
jgi:hypothetical protein